jgi:hypothetical protein
MSCSSNADLSRRPRKLSLALSLPFPAVVFSLRNCKSVPSCLVVCLRACEGQASEAAGAPCLAGEQRDERFLAHRLVLRVLKSQNRGRLTTKRISTDEKNSYNRHGNKEECPHRERKRKEEGKLRSLLSCSRAPTSLRDPFDVRLPVKRGGNGRGRSRECG